MRVRSQHRVPGSAVGSHLRELNHILVPTGVEHGPQAVLEGCKPRWRVAGCAQVLDTQGEGVQGGLTDSTQDVGTGVRSAALPRGEPAVAALLGGRRGFHELWRELAAGVHLGQRGGLVVAHAVGALAPCVASGLATAAPGRDRNATRCVRQLDVGGEAFQQHGLLVGARAGRWQASKDGPRLDGLAARADPRSRLASRRRFNRGLLWLADRGDVGPEPSVAVRIGSREGCCNSAGMGGWRKRRQVDSSV